MVSQELPPSTPGTAGTWGGVGLRIDLQRHLTVTETCCASLLGFVGFLVLLFLAIFIVAVILFYSKEVFVSNLIL